MEYFPLTRHDLRHCYDALHDQINTLMEEWEKGKCKDQQLDDYIDELCEVKDKISKLINVPKI